MVATTNRPQMLDRALLRPGRFDKIIYVGPPDQAAREEIFRLYLGARGNVLADNIDYARLAAISEKYTGADIEGLVNSVMSSAFYNKVLENKEQKITITASTGLDKSNIEKMVKEAEAHAAEDRKERERAEARNEADNLIYTTDKSLRDYGSKISEADRKDIETAIAELRKVMDSQNTAEIKSKSEALKQAAYRLAEELGVDSDHLLRLTEAAELLGWADRVGTLEPGRFADVIAVIGSIDIVLGEIDR
jgi:SpoVK/Ycf46/Vps4 family AAA+-type ATPase